MILLIFMKTLYLWNIKSTMKYTILILVLISLFSCNHNTLERFNPLGEIPLPDSTLFTAQNIELGRKMFFDTRLSLDDKVSCATCHKPEYAFADKAPVTLGVRARQGSRNAPSLMNVGYLPHMMAEGMVKSLEMQMLDPLQDETEMSMDLNQLVNKLKTESFYVQQAKEIYGRELDMFVVTRAISAYQRTLISNNSAFDQYYYHNPQSIKYFHRYLLKYIHHIFEVFVLLLVKNWFLLQISGSCLAAQVALCCEGLNPVLLLVLAVIVV